MLIRSIWMLAFLLIPPMSCVAAAEDNEDTREKKVVNSVPPEAWQAPWVNDVPLDLLPNVVFTPDKPGTTLTVDALPKVDSISQYGITWKFDKKVPAGRFVNGDWYVVGPVTVIDIEPKTVVSEETLPDGKKKIIVRHGSMHNFRVSTNNPIGFDNRVINHFEPKALNLVPISLKPGDNLMSTISSPLKEYATVRRMLGPFNSSHKSVCGIKVAAVLLCMDKPVATDAFRPPYMATAHPLYYARNLKRDFLPSLPRLKEVLPYNADGEPQYFKKNTETGRAELCYDIRAYERYFRLPWLDTVFFSFSAPSQNMPQYGRELGRIVGNAALLLCLDFTREQKERLIINFCQVGIDRWGMLLGGHPGWRAFGGHGSGRKLSIELTGVFLGDEEMQNPYKKFPNVEFGEDMQVVDEKSWTGADVSYAGHYGRKFGSSERNPQGTEYEYMPPTEWKTKAAFTGESYRRCCTGICWVAQALAIRFMKIEKVWNNDPFMRYCDRWMTEKDADNVKIIHDSVKLETIAEIKKVEKDPGFKFDYRPDYMAGGTTWDSFVNEIYATYRNKQP